MIRRLAKPLAVFVTIALFGAALGEIAHVAKVGGGVAYALAGGVFALLVVFGVRFAFGDWNGYSDLLACQRIEQVQPEEATVSADDWDRVVPARDIDAEFVALTSTYERYVFGPEGPSIPSAGRAVAGRAFGLEISTDSVEVGHGNGGIKQRRRRG